MFVPPGNKIKQYFRNVKDFIKILQRLKSGTQYLISSDSESLAAQVAFCLFCPPFIDLDNCFEGKTPKLNVFKEKQQ